MVISTKKEKGEDSSLNDDEVNALLDLQHSFESIKEEISKVIGQEEAIEKIFICMLSQGHTPDGRSGTGQNTFG